MKVEPKIGDHRVNSEWEAKSRLDLNAIVTKSLPIQRGVAKSTFSSKVPDQKEASRVSHAFQQCLKFGKI
jgi:hypothetical protein